MQRSPAAAPPTARSGSERVAVFACAALSAAFIVLDVKGGAFDAARPDLGIELVARVLMLILALFATVRMRSNPEVRLLVWAVLFVSLDAYWQTTYKHVGGRPLEWIEMVVKYVGVGAGLGVLLRLCSSFGDAPPTRFRAFLHDRAYAIGAALAVVGLVHGVIYIQHCYYFDPGTGECVFDNATLFSTRAYLIANAAVRLAIVAAAVIGYRRSTLEYKQRTMVVAYFSVWFALGTAVDFVARQPLPYFAVLLLQVGDAVTTLLFPLGLLYAATRKRLFDVEYVVKKTTSYSLSALVVLLLLAGVETLLHELWMGPFHGEEHPSRESSLSLVAIEFFAGVLFVLCWKPFEKWLEEVLDRTMPERAERLERLRGLINKIPYVASLAELRTELRDGLSAAVSAQFADIFLHDGNAGFGAYISNRAPEPLYLSENEPPVTEIARGGHVCLGCQDEKVPKAELALPMPVRGKPYGILICGAPLHEIVHFAHDEIERLKEFAATAGSALFAFGAKLRPEPPGTGERPKRAPRKKPAAVSSSPPQEAL
ncbi:MAG: hypothetical protein JWN27_565 [Candidatus Eremiobacteraeota bacterium]|nr:hypothetical protein [Candidatus Eremiobacteraeota bacterium]